MSVSHSSEERGRFSFAALPEEIRLTLLLFLFSFFISGVPRVYTQTAAHTLFIDVYGAAAMPWAYLAEALCVPLAGYLYIRAEQTFSLRTLLVGTLVSQIVALLLFRAGIAMEVPLVAGATIVYFEIEFVLSSLLLWGLANQLMTLRQGKRLFGFVSAGEPVAIIICGLSTPLLLQWMSPADLFLLSALGAGVGIVLVLGILRRHRPLASEDEGEDNDGAQVAAPKAWWRNRYVVTMVVLVAVGQMGYFFVDNAFYVEAGKRYPEEEQLASFLGVYSAVMGTISLVCSVLLAPFLLRRFGVRGGLLVLPVLLLTGSLSTVLASALGGPADLLFLLVVGNKVIDQSFRYTLDKTTFVTLFQPLPAGQRIRVQAGLESIVEPLSGGIAGLLLFAMIHALGFGAVGITGVILAVACVWTGLVAVQYRGYLGSLREALAGRGVSAGGLSLDDDESRAMVRQGLSSARPGEVLYCLSLLDSLELPLTETEAANLLRHAAREVRLDIARRIEHGLIRFPALELISVIGEECDAEVKGMLIEALAAADEDLVPEVVAHLDDPEERVRLGASTGLIRHGGVEGVLAVGPRLLEDLRSPETAQRRFAAMVMGRAGSAHFYRPLLELLRDREIDVARAALRAAGEIGTAKLWPAMTEALQRPELESAAIAALSAIGDPVLPAIDELHGRDDIPSSLRYALVAVYGRIASHAADSRLSNQLKDPRRAVRTRVLRTLWRRRYRCPPARFPLLRELVFAEVDAAATALAAWSRLRGIQGEELDLLRRVLADEVARCVQNCFALLSLMAGEVNMQEAYASYEKGGPSRRSYVVEMLDNMLDLELKRRLFPLIEPESLDERAQRLAVQQAATGEAGDFLARLATDEHAAALVRACAAYAAAMLGVRNIPVAEVGGGDAVVTEMLAWIRSGCPAIKERNKMLTIEKMLVLKSVGLFAAVREEYLASAAASATEVRLATGEALFAEGDFGTSLFVIVSGRIEVTAAGKRVAELGERDVVGEMAALDPEPRSATVKALEDTLLIRLTNEDLDLLMSEDVEVARGIIQTLCKRLRNVLVAPPARDKP